MDRLKLMLAVIAFTFFTTALAKTEAYIELLNGTPYDWVLEDDWRTSKLTWEPPATIPAGTGLEAYVYWHWNSREAGGEATYRIANPHKSEAFTLVVRQNPTRVEVVYQEQLESLNNPLHSRLDLGYQWRGALPFILAGDGVNSPYVGSNPPVNWIQKTLGTIGNKTMREFAMPCAHDAGANKVTHALSGPGTLHNTQTQSLPVYGQLKAGARMLDIRPLTRKGQWFTMHASRALGTMWGATGQSIKSIVDDINKFNDEFPGELIILDISHEMSYERNYDGLHIEEWQNLYQALGEIQDLWIAPPHGLPIDLSTVPLSSFVTQGSESTVLIRIPNIAPMPHGESRDSREVTLETNGTTSLNATLTPSHNETETPSISARSPRRRRPRPSKNVASRPFSHSAFIHHHRLPQTGSYSNTHTQKKLVKDQLGKLHALKSHSGEQPHKTVWIETQPLIHQADVANWYTSILGYAVEAHHALFRELWTDVTNGWYGGVIPNIVEVDDVSSAVTALCVALNEWAFGEGEVVTKPEKPEPKRGRKGKGRKGGKSPEEK